VVSRGLCVLSGAAWIVGTALQAEFDRAHGGTGDIKPTTSAWSWSKPKDGKEFGDEDDFRAEHRVQMAHFDQMKIKERHLVSFAPIILFFGDFERLTPHVLTG